MKQKNLKVYLDTMITIKGPEYPEHHRLIQLSKEGFVKLFVSQKTTLERRARSTKQREKINGILKKEDSLSREKFMEIYSEALDQEKKLRDIEKKEVKFWMPAKPETAKSTFTALTWIGLFGSDLITIYDIKKEIPLFNELLTFYNISEPDAFHLMEAHSDNMDYFLTWDDKLIKKSSRVKWLKPKVLTPKEFLEKANP